MLINLTPHIITVFAEADAVDAGRGTFTLKEGALPVLTLESKGVARATVREQCIGTSEGFPVFRMEYGQPTDLPEPADGVGYVVSALTAQAAQRVGRDTSDLYMVAHTVRDSAGRIIGCLGFSQL